MGNSDKIKVFLVDDDEFFLETISDALSQNKNVALSSFTSAEQCLAKMDEKPDLVFLDHMLNGGNPDMLNGIDALPKIIESNPLTKVIMLTGQEDLAIAEDMMRSGAYYYIPKDENCVSVMEKKVNLILALV